MACGWGSRTLVGPTGTRTSRNSALKSPVSVLAMSLFAVHGTLVPPKGFICLPVGMPLCYVCTVHITLLWFNFLICKMVTETVMSIPHMQTPRLLKTSWGCKVNSGVWKNGGNRNQAIIPYLPSFQSWSQPFPILTRPTFPLLLLPMSDRDWKKRMQREGIIDKSEGKEEKVNLNVLKGKVEPDFPPVSCSSVPALLVKALREVPNITTVPLTLTLANRWKIRVG